jgi:hypothetical protein
LAINPLFTTYPAHLQRAARIAQRDLFADGELSLGDFGAVAIQAHRPLAGRVLRRSSGNLHFETVAAAVSGVRDGVRFVHVTVRLDPVD